MSARSPDCFVTPSTLSEVFPARGMADLCSRVNGADGPRRIGRLAQFPWAAELLGLVLEVAPGHIEADAVSINIVERRLDRNVAPALAERHHHLNLEMVVGRFRRVWKLSGLARRHR